MAEFKLTSRQAEFLLKLAEHSLETGNQSYHFVVGTGQWTGGFRGTDQESDGLDHLPINLAFYMALSKRGYLEIHEAPEHRQSFKPTIQIALIQKVFDFNDYHQMSPWRQKWTDLRYDLGKDTTFRSKVIWSLATAALAVLVSILLSRIGVV